MNTLFNMRSHWMKVTVLSFFICHLSFSPARAQGDDFGIWTELGLEKKISSKLSLDAGMELRTRDDGFGELDRWSAGVGASYELTPWLKASAAYSLLYDHNHKVNTSGKKYGDYWGARHRFSVSLTAARQFGNLTVSLRERWQYTYRPEKTVSRYYVYDSRNHDADEYADEHTYSGKGSNKWRNRLQLKYKLTKQWRPYVNAESTVGGSGLDKMRYAAGTEWRLTKRHIFDLHYMYQHMHKDDSEADRHVLGLGYTYKF